MKSPDWSLYLWAVHGRKAGRDVINSEKNVEGAALGDTNQEVARFVAPVPPREPPQLLAGMKRRAAHLQGRTLRLGRGNAGMNR